MKEIEEASANETGMGCVLRVCGDDFDVDSLLTQVRLKPCNVYRNGLPRFGPKSRIAVQTGFNVSTSDASETNLFAQIEDTVIFLGEHRDDLKFMMSFPGVTGAELDFSVACRIGKNDIVAQSDFFPPKLLLLAGQHGIGIRLSNYLTSEEFDDA